MTKIAIVSAQNTTAKKAGDSMKKKYKTVEPKQADVIIALGGDGFLLKTLHKYKKPVFGMHCGTVGFLLNQFSEDDLLARLKKTERAILHPLKIKVEDENGKTKKALAINEISLLRSSPQAAKLKITIDGKVRMEELVCDGILVATPAGSTAYNLSAHGPVVPLGSKILALTPLSPFRPRRWNGALLPHSAKIKIEVLKNDKRPVMAAADDLDLGRVKTIHVEEDESISFELLYDPERHLEERILQEQFDT